MAKKIPLYPRTDFAKKSAKEFLIASKIKALPINPFALCKQHGFVIRSVSETEDLINVIDPFEVRSNPDCDAKTYLTSEGRYIIVYDDAVLSQGRIVWTIAHEIGHIVLKHLAQFEQTEIHKGLTEKENEVLEKEADAFAAEFLAPAEVLLHCGCVKKSMIIKLCGLSDEAATYREERLRTYVPDHKYLDTNQEILKQFYNFIDSKAFFVNLHQKICPVCKNYIFGTREHFCRICGRQITGRTLTKGIVYHDGPEISKQKRTYLCPKCQRTQDAKTGSTCIHCKSSLINQCSNPTCAVTHAGSSRYCYKCGNPNVFFLEDVLPDWETAQKAFEDWNLLIHLLENDKDTGRILDEWQYLLSFMKKDGEFLLYTSLKKSIAKIDYDTLYIYSESAAIKDWLKNNEAVCAYIIKLMRKMLNLHILEILPLVVGSDGSISYEE